MIEHGLFILQHSLGVDGYGRGPQYRNKFVTGPGGKDFVACQTLTKRGLMIDHGAKEAFGDMHVFTVTPAGIDYVALNSPAPHTAEHVVAVDGGIFCPLFIYKGNGII